MKPLKHCAMLGALTVLSVAQAVCLPPAFAADQKIIVKGWRMCSADVSEASGRCVSAQSLHQVKVFDASGAPGAPADLSALQPAGERDFNADFNLVALPASGGTVWVQAKILDVVFCDKPQVATRSAGTAQGTSAMAMGSGPGCHQ